jgi:hypothetical protein
MVRQGRGWDLQQPLQRPDVQPVLSGAHQQPEKPQPGPVAQRFQSFGDPFDLHALEDSAPAYFCQPYF